MPELDLDAIRARAEAVVRLIGKPDRPVTGPEPSAFVLAARDVPALLARLTEVEARAERAGQATIDQAVRADEAEASVERLEARLTEVEGERDQAERSIEAHRAMTNDANARLRGVLLAALGLDDDGRTSLTEYVGRLAGEYARLRQQVAEQAELARKTLAAAVDEDIRTRRVVEAAKALRASFGPTTSEYLADLDMARLVAAVDALQEGPVSPPERLLPPDQPSDVTSSTDGNVAQEGSRGAGDNLGNVVGRTLVLGVPLGPPADPPWLEEAIEAVQQRLDDLGTEGRDDEGTLDGSLWLDGLDSVAEDLVRAALPLIAEGVLGETADDLAARQVTE